MATADLFGPEAEAPRLLLDQLIQQSKLYSTSKEYLDLLNFVSRLRSFAPFNAMLLQVQKPGLVHAASLRDWRERFGRKPKEKARPLLILRPFGPVALVYDLLDTEGRPVPAGAFTFPARGDIPDSTISDIVERLYRRLIRCEHFDGGDSHAGQIHREAVGDTPKQYSRYVIGLNGNHSTATQFTTLAHELAHLCLGHLGEDRKLKVPGRMLLHHSIEEVEAESVAFLVCHRFGITTLSQSYLAGYVDERTTIDTLEIFQILRAAGQVEELMGIAAHQQPDRPRF